MLSRRTALIGGIATVSTSFIPTPAMACGATVRIIVSLADNKNQGIVPIPASLGNGQDPANNLYWGAMYGVNSYLKRQDGWQVREMKTDSFRPHVLAASAIQFGGPDTTFYAEAWDGAQQRKAIQYFMDLLKNPIDGLTVFVGHNPLMDGSVPFPVLTKSQVDENRISKRKFAVIACQSRRYFEEGIKATGHIPYVLTEGNMAPEAYVVEAIVRAWMEDGSPQKAREYAAAAYAKYQKIPLKNANWLFGV